MEDVSWDGEINLGDAIIALQDIADSSDASFAGRFTIVVKTMHAVAGTSSTVILRKNGQQDGKPLVVTVHCDQLPGPPAIALAGPGSRSLHYPDSPEVFFSTIPDIPPPPPRIAA